MPDNPFDITVLNEVRPTYVGPPVEDIAAAREYLTKTGRENQEAKILLEGAFSDTVNALSEDPEGVNLVKQHANDFVNSTRDMISRGDYAYLGPTIRGMAAKFAGDYRIKNRKTRLAEFQGKRDAMLENDNIDEDAKQVFAKQPYKFNGNDELGTSSPTKFFSPYERVDVNGELLKAAKQLLPDGTPITGIRFAGDGTDTAYAILTNGQRLTLSKGDLMQAFRGVVNNNPALKNYIFQSAAIGEHYNDAEATINAIENAVQNPDLYQEVINKASDDLATALAYNNTDIRTTLQNISLQGSNSSSSGIATPNTIYGAGVNTPTINPSEDELNKSITNTDTQLNNLFDQPGLAVGTDATKTFNDAVANNDGETVRNFAAANGISPSKLHEYISTSQALQFDKALSQAKLDNARNAAMYDENGKPKFGLLSNVGNDKDVQALADMGYNYQSTTGNSNFDIDKVMSTLDQVDANYKRINETIARKRVDRLPILPGEEEAYSKASRAKTYANNIRSRYKKEYRRYNKEFNDILEAKNKAHDEITTDKILGYDIKSNTATYKQLERIFTSPASLRDMKVFDASNERIDPSFFDDKNIKKLSIDNITLSPTKAGDTGSSSWVIPYEITQYGKNSADGPIIRGKFRIPVESDKGGVEQEIFTNLVKNNPYYKAGKMVDEVMLNNIEGKFNIPGNEDFSINRDARSGKVTYSSPQYPNDTRDAFTKRLANRIVGKELEFIIGDTTPSVISAFDSIKSKDYNNEQEYIDALKNKIYDELDKGSFDLNALDNNEASALISQIISSLLNARR